MAYSTAIDKRSQALNYRPNNPNHLASHLSHASATTRLLVSLAAVLLVVAVPRFNLICTRPRSTVARRRPSRRPIPGSWRWRLTRHRSA